jgi:hypothetical protein
MEVGSQLQKCEIAEARGQIAEVKIERFKLFLRPDS